MKKVRKSRRRIGLLAMASAALMSIGMAGGGVAPASAANEAFCTFASVGAGAACANPTLRKITRVNATSINNSVCAGAFNSSGVQVGGWTCTGEGGETSNGNYDGSKFLKGAVLNNYGTTQVVGGGLEYYNP